MGLIYQWIQAHGRSGMIKYYREKYERDSVYISLKEIRSKRAKKSKITGKWDVIVN